MLYTDGLLFVDFETLPTILQSYYLMKAIIAILLWFILLALCWPLALGLFFVFMIGGIVLLPFAIAGVVLGVFFKILAAIFLLPFKLLRAI